MILDYEVDAKALIILGRTFISNGCVLIDMELKYITFKLNDE